MRIMLHALGGSLFVHIVYMGIMMTIGWVKTKQYEPQFPLEDTVLQSEISFGFVGNPLYFLMTYIGSAYILAVIFIIRKRMRHGMIGN